MSLAAAAVRALVESGRVELGLALRGAEIKVDGYSRQPAPKWSVQDGEARAEVSFGPFRSRVEYDAGVLIIDGEIVDLLPNRDGLPDSVGPGSKLGYAGVLRALDADPA
jgi:hypothetical protein